MESRAPAIADVVLVEDDAAVSNALQFAIETEGLTVRAYACAEALLEDAARGARTCLVLDYRLPGIDGLELLARLRAAGTVCPALLITTNPSIDLRLRARKLGASIVEKPLLSDTLLLAIRGVARDTRAF